MKWPVTCFVVLLFLLACKQQAGKKKDYRLPGTWKVVEVEGFRFPGKEVAARWRGREKDLLKLYRSFTYQFTPDSSFYRRIPDCSGKNICLSGKIRKDTKYLKSFVFYDFCDKNEPDSTCPSMWMMRFGPHQYEVSILVRDYGMISSRIAKEGD